MRKISLEQLLIDPKYKQLSLFDLHEVINEELINPTGAVEDC
jgi:hypothetical protein